MANLKVNTVSGIGTEGTVFDGGLKFRSLNYMTLPKGDTAQRGRGRGLWAGGTVAPETNIIQYAELSSQGNTIDFGDLSVINDSPMATASATRAVYGGGRLNPSYYNNIDTVEIATTANATDFGDLTAARKGGQGCGNQTRGLFGPGFSPTPTNRNVNTIDFITIATLGNAQDFGDFTEDIRGVAALSSPTRGIFAGGYAPSSPNLSNTIQFITIATTGNSTDFGDLTVGGQGCGANSNSIRGVFGGRTNPSKQNVIDFVQIATTGNAVDFGDMLSTIANAAGTSDSNGGLAE